MKILLNGQQVELAQPVDIESLLQTQGYTDMKVAVARNKGFVPRTAYGTTSVEDGDEIEILAPMQGG